MSDFFDSVLKFFQSIGDVIQMIFDSFNSFTDILSTFIPTIQSDAMNFLPAFVQPFVMLCLGILIIKAVLDLI